MFYDLDAYQAEVIQQYACLVLVKENSPVTETLQELWDLKREQSWDTS